MLDLGQLARVDGVKDGTSGLERAALADSAGVEQPGVCVVLLDLVGRPLGDGRFQPIAGSLASA